MQGSVPDGAALDPGEASVAAAPVSESAIAEDDNAALEGQAAAPEAADADGDTLALLPKSTGAESGQSSVPRRVSFLPNPDDKKSGG
eukprot:3424543-Prymnesium_polylepis.1